MPDTHTARDALRRAVAAEFQRLDAHDWGYDHGFCADPDADEETAAFVDAAIRIVRQATFREVDEVLHGIAQKQACFNEAEMQAAAGHTWSSASALRMYYAATTAAAPTTPTTKEK